jgi:uncharacterized protein YndB with AHSA1/START domain
MSTSAPETTYTAEPGSLEATTVAVIDAPREAVYRCFVDPELLPKWWAPPELKVEIEKLGTRHGESWRVLNIDEDGNEYAFRGAVHEIVPNERICQTFEFESLPGHVAMQTATFEDADGGTRVHEQMVFQSVEDRDGMSESGMKEHAPVSMAQLAEVARSL